MYDIGTDYVIITRDEAMHVFGLAAISEHRAMDEQVALLRLARWLDLVPREDAVDIASITWRMTDDEWVTGEDHAAALDAAGLLVETAVH
ncbi:MAG: hypothetical protein U0U69_11535 [Acidimicrobiia bacterium]